MPGIFCWLAFAILPNGLLQTNALSPPVKVELRSSWPAPPLLLECIESIAIEEPDAFFPLLDVLTNLETRPNTPAAWHHYTLETALEQNYLSQPGAYASADMNLALHLATPKIEAFFQYYQDRVATRKTAASGSNCESWVDWYGQIICDVDSLVRLAGRETIDSAGASARSSFDHPKLLPFDHVHPSLVHTLERPPHTAILYASLDSDNFRELHSYLYNAASAPSPHLEYVLRPIPSVGRDGAQQQSLSGYGVALDLKKMDYLALDDRRQRSSGHDAQSDNTVDMVSTPDLVSALIHQYPENTTLDASASLTDDELLEVGLQATQLIYDADEPLATLKQLVQNFPKYAVSLARRVTVDPALLDEVEENQEIAQGGVSMAWLNGMNIAAKDWTPFGLLRLMRKERTTMMALTGLGLSTQEAVTLLTHPSIGVTQGGQLALDGFFDASDRAEEGGVIGWLNDISQDSRYARWGTSLQMLLRPMFPGQFANVRFNVFNVVLAIDLSQSSSLHFLAASVSSIINRHYPFRFGIAPLVETKDSAQMTRLFFWLLENYGRPQTLGFISRIAQQQTPIHTMTPTVKWQLVRSEFNALQFGAESLKEGADHANFDAILEGTDGDLDKQRMYAARLGLSLVGAEQGHVFVNGRYFTLDDDFIRSMQMDVNLQMQHVQGQLRTGGLTDRDAERIETYFYDLPGTAKRRNRHIYPSGKMGSLRIHSLADITQKIGLGSLVYPPVSDAPDSDRQPLTTYVVADLDSEAGLALVREALISAKPGTRSRFSFIHNPGDVSSPQSPSSRTRVSSLLAHLVSKGALYRVSPVRLLEMLGFGDPVAPITSPQVVISPEGSLDDILEGALLDDTETYEAFVKMCRLAAREFGFAPGQHGLIVNGRVVGPMEKGEFVVDDFEILMDYEMSKRVQPVADVLYELLGYTDEYTNEKYAEIISIASSIVSSIQLPDPSEVGLSNAPLKARRRTYQAMSGDYTAYVLGDNSTALYHFGFVIDPLSEAAQKWTSLIEWLLNIPGVTVDLRLNPARYTELPLKRFYRYNLHPRLAFDENGQEVAAQTEFAGLAVEPIYTLAMDVPSSWLVRPRESPHDLDNIQLRSLSSRDRAHGVQAVFSLDDLVVEGHARDTFTGQPPRGVQLQLVTSDGKAIADTQVVANLGYLQFRTTPGVFRLEIRPGRGRDIFRMESVGNDGWASPAVETGGDEITLTSFEGLTLYPRLARLPGKERADVLREDDPAVATSKGVLGDVVSRVSSLFSKGNTTAVAVSGGAQADINIFTVASGLLYERFASIMILSVLRNTKKSVKFWFIENFLSPSFLEFIPHFAEEYGFQYELVTYKWPSWLRAQKEKQRIIWAYKILFLDVLFPMDLKKVIFVDADQIVRADLQELVDLDLHGAPYGYTPMGDDNVEMEGFRFWKTGYWAEFLRGLPYHISALYVVDLIRFRQIAAGDMLRAQYQALSADPNSLANLDQDLPNNLQREVPIFSLPEDWLWCETWCSKDRLHRAKTIDLCQNPLTKEPKLARARQIPEWEEYDAEIARLARRLAEEGRIRSEIAAADANVLAEASAGRPVSSDSPDGSQGEEDRPRDEL